MFITTQGFAPNEKIVFKRPATWDCVTCKGLDKHPACNRCITKREPTMCGPCFSETFDT